MTFKASMSIFMVVSQLFFPGRKFQNVYKVGRRLGDGSFGSVSVFPGRPVVGGLFFFSTLVQQYVAEKRGVGFGLEDVLVSFGAPFGGLFKGVI